MFLLYMETINTDPFTNGMISTIIDVDDGLAYYRIPVGFHLFKATKSSDTLNLSLGRLSFFGVYNTDPHYIESYEKEYGIIFAFKTTRSYKLLALDHPNTKTELYNRAPNNIKQILRRNYGYNSMSGYRDSKLDSDIELSQYLCKQGYQGYATHFMETDTGEFHPEFMICKVDGITPIGRITNLNKIASILDEGTMFKRSLELKESRKKPKSRFDDDVGSRSPFPNANPFATYSPGSPVAPSTSYKLSFDMVEDDKENSPPNKNPFNSSIFKDDDTDDENRGGTRKRKIRSYKNRKTRTNKRKRSKKKGTRRKR